MTKMLNRIIACLLALILLVSSTPSYTAAAEQESLYDTASEDIIIEEADLVEDAPEVSEEEESDAYLPSDDEVVASLPEDLTAEEKETTDELDDEETEEITGTEAEADEFKGIYNLKVIWPDGASNSIELE